MAMIIDARVGSVGNGIQPRGPGWEVNVDRGGEGEGGPSESMATEECHDVRWP